MRAPVPILAAAFALVASCVQYNDPCQVVENPDQVLGYLGQDVYLDKPHARHANNAIGQLAADAFLHSMDGDPAAAAELGVINGGGIRAEGFCVSRDLVKKGPLTKGALHEILLFDNHVVTLDLTADELVRVFSNAYSGLSQYGQPIGSGPGNFLHVSQGSEVRVDCSVPGTASAPGRLTFLRIGSKVLVGPGAVPPDAGVRVAITDFLINFGGGTSDVLHGLDVDPDRRPRIGGIDSDIAEQYMAARYAERSPGLVEDLALDGGRVAWETDGGVPTCASP